MLTITALQNSPKQTPCYRLYERPPHEMPAHLRNSIAYGYGEEGRQALEKLLASKEAFDSMPLVGGIRLHPVGNTETVRRMPNGEFAYFSIYGGHLYQLCTVSAGEVLHHLINAAGWTRKKYEFSGIAGFQQTPDGTFQGGSGNRSYIFDYRVAPDGKELNLHTCRSYRDIYKMPDKEASEAVKRYFGI